MPTTVTKSIKSDGTGDYTTVQAWEDALPADITAGGNDTVQVGELYNTAEYAVAGSVVNFSGTTTDAGHTVTLKAAAGQSFRDNASVQSNALRYNQSNGVGLRRTAAYGHVIDIGYDYITIQGLQIAHTDTTGAAAALHNPSFQHVVIENCILEAPAVGSTNGVVQVSAGTVRNCLVVLRNASGGVGIYFNYVYGTPAVYNCTVVRPSDKTAAQSAFVSLSGTTTIKNCAAFGFTNFVNDATKFTGSNNCSDVSIGFGTSNQASKTYANQFQNTADATRDFRLKTGADCVDTGVTDSTNAATDIAGTSRPSGAAYDIGAWELVTGSPSSSVSPSPSPSSSVSASPSPSAAPASYIFYRRRR